MSELLSSHSRDAATITARHAAGPETRTLPLLQGRTSLAEALEEEENMLFRLAYPSQRTEFYVWILQHRKDFEAIVSHHLSLASNEICQFAEVKDWRPGSFNVCIPISIDNWRKHPGRRVLLRIPLPYKVGESACPGNADEKLRTEAATFIWIGCPDIPIPYLWGFGLPGGRSFTRPENAPFGKRVVWHLRRAVQSLFRSTLPCRYINYNRQDITGHGYLIMDYIETTDTEMLSETWTSHCQNQDLRFNLFQDLSRIMLSLSQLPLPRIGSWTMDDQGFLTLTNRPLIHQFHSFENEHIPTKIARTLTYTTAEAYYLDLLYCHDSRIRNQPNSISDEKDGYTQMANLVTMRGLLPHFTSRSMRQGPFAFSLTDLHGSNIFVDSKWRIKYIIDLEWACSLPIEMISPPYWITSHAVDELDGDELPKFEKAYQDFTDIFEEEEKSLPSPYGSATHRTDIMRMGLKTGNFYPKGLYNLFWQHLQPIFEPCRDGLKTDVDRFSQVVSPYWTPDARDTVVAKLNDKKKYEEELRQLFKKKGEPEHVN